MLGSLHDVSQGEQVQVFVEQCRANVCLKLYAINMIQFHHHHHHHRRPQ